MNDQPAGAPHKAAPRSFAALRHPGYRAYFVCAAVAMMADNVEHVISYWMMFQRFHSPALAGFAVLSHWLPFLFFSVYAGALADRFELRRLIQAGMALFLIASVGWGVVFVTGALEVWQAVALLVIHGFAGVLWAPAGQLLIHDIVGQSQLQSAVRLTAISRQLGLLAGPAVGGAILLAFGPSWGIFLNALFYVPVIWWLQVTRYGRRGERAPARSTRGFSDIVATVRAVAGNRVIVIMTALAGSVSLLVSNAYQAQMPEFAYDLGHGDPDFTYSMLLGADAAGALVAGLVLEASGLLQARTRTVFVLVLLWCGAIAAFAGVDYYPLALVLLFCAGFLELSFNAMAQTLVQLHAPADIRGRALGLYNMSALGLRAFSGVTVGFGGSVIGIHWSLGLSAIALGLVTLTFALMARSRPAAP